MYLGEKIKSIRESKNISRKELAIRTKSSENHIRQLELRLRKDIKATSLCRMAVALDISLDELIKDTEFDYTNKENTNDK